MGFSGKIDLPLGNKVLLYSSYSASTKKLDEQTVCCWWLSGQRSFIWNSPPVLQEIPFNLLNVVYYLKKIKLGRVGHCLLWLNMKWKFLPLPTMAWSESYVLKKYVFPLISVRDHERSYLWQGKLDVFSPSTNYSLRPFQWLPSR